MLGAVIGPREARHGQVGERLSALERPHLCTALGALVLSGAQHGDHREGQEKDPDTWSPLLSLCTRLCSPEDQQIHEQLASITACPQAAMAQREEQRASPVTHKASRTCIGGCLPGAPVMQQGPTVLALSDTELTVHV